MDYQFQHTGMEHRMGSSFHPQLLLPGGIQMVVSGTKDENEDGREQQQWGCTHVVGQFLRRRRLFALMDYGAMTLLWSALLEMYLIILRSKFYRRYR